MVGHDRGVVVGESLQQDLLHMDERYPDSLQVVFGGQLLRHGFN